MPISLTNAPVTIMDHINIVEILFGHVMVLLIHDILIYFDDRNKHINYSNTVLQTIREQ